MGEALLSIEELAGAVKKEKETLKLKMKKQYQHHFSDHTTAAGECKLTLPLPWARVECEW